MSDFHVIIRGDSMWPTFSDGEKVKASELSEEELTIGDIVVSKHPLKSKLIITNRYAVEDIEPNSIPSNNL